MSSIESKDILFIINPNSGSKKAAQIIEEINSIDLAISTVITDSLEALETVFKEDIDKYKAFVAVGGDGTVNEIMKYLFGKKDKFFAVYPMGSGNGFSREMGFDNSIPNLIEKIKKGNFVSVDVLEINENKCINASGLGFDSYVAHHFQNTSRGLKSYIKLSIKSIFTYKPFKAVFKFHTKTLEGIYHTVAIANTRQYGNNALISPQSDPTDGAFELVLIRPFPIYYYLIFTYQLFRGKLNESKYVEYIKIKDSLGIKTDFGMYHVDGEPKTFTESLSIKMMDEKLHVIV